MLSLFSRNRLLAVFLVFIFGPFFLATVITGVIILDTLEKKSEEKLQDEVELVARALQPSVSASLEQGRPSRIQQDLKSVFEIRRLFNASVYNQSGRLLTSVGPKTSVSDQIPVIELKDKGNPQSEYQDDGLPVFSVFVPLTSEAGKSIGILHLTRERKDIDKHLSDLRFQVFGVIFLFVLLSLFILFLGLRFTLFQPIKSLQESMRLVKKGVKSHRTKETGPLELRQLASSFNGMLESLEKNEKALKLKQTQESALKAQLYRSERLASIGQLSAGLAHELGTPLSILNVLIQRLRKQNSLNHKSLLLADEMQDEVKRTENIVRQLLDFASDRTNSMQRIDLRQPIQSALDRLQNSSDWKKLFIDVDLPSQGVFLNGNNEKIERMIINILKNSLQIESCQWVGIQLAETEKSIDLLIEDDGPGISKEILEKIFEPFFTTKSVGGGSGLGLSVVHGIVREHGGKIQSFDRKPHGTGFLIRFEKDSDLERAS